MTRVNLEESVCDIPLEDAEDHDFVSDDRIQKFFDPKRIKNKDVFCHAICL